MVVYSDLSSMGSLGHGFQMIIDEIDDYTGLQLVIISNSKANEVICLDSIKSIRIYDDCAVFINTSGIREFLNFKNVLSMSLIGD